MAVKVTSSSGAHTHTYEAIPGPIGPTGAKGTQGVQGLKGNTGVQGIQGTAGSVDLSGVQAQITALDARVKALELSKPTTPAPLTRPFPAPVTTRTVIVPASIDATGATDVSTALTNFILSVPDGATINFPAAGIYRIDSAIEFTGRHNLIIDGNGCTLEYTSITGTLEHYSLWRDMGTGSDIWIKNFVLIGSSPYPGILTEGDSPTGGEWQHGVIVISDRFEVSGCTMSALWGDGLTVDGGATDVWLHDNHVISAGRNGLSIISGTNVIAERNAFDRAGLIAFDVEPNHVTESCINIIFRNNTIGTFGKRFFTVWSHDISGVIIDGIGVDGNIVTGASLFTNVSNDTETRITRVTFTNNTGKETKDIWAVVVFQYIDGLTVTGNIQPLSSGALTGIIDCTGVVKQS